MIRYFQSIITRRLYVYFTPYVVMYGNPYVRTKLQTKYNLATRTEVTV